MITLGLAEKHRHERRGVDDQSRSLGQAVGPVTEDLVGWSRVANPPRRAAPRNLGERLVASFTRRSSPEALEALANGDRDRLGDALAGLGGQLAG